MTRLLNMLLPLLLALMLTLALPLTTAEAEIFKWTDASGRVHFTDKPENSEARPVELGPINTYNAPSKIFIDETLARPVTKSSKTYGVTIYSTTWCGVCKKAKKWLRAKRISFRDYDIEKSARGRADYKKLKKNGGGVPIILLGKQRMNGFSEARMLTMLRNANYNI